jgi:hypothetical protein
VTEPPHIKHCSRYYSDEYRLIKIRDLEIDESRGQQAPPKLVTNRLGIIVKTLTVPSPDEVPLLHALGILADNLSSRGVTVSFYEYEPVGISVDRSQELKTLIRHLSNKLTPSLIVVPKLMGTVLAGLAVEEGLDLSLMFTITITRDLVFYLPKGFVPVIRFLVKRNSRASYRKYELIKNYARLQGFNVGKEKLFGGNGEILEYLSNEARSEGVGALLKNIPVTRLSLTVLSTLRCLGKMDLVKREAINSGETETFLVVSTHPSEDIKSLLRDALHETKKIYVGSNAYPRATLRTRVINRMGEALETEAVKEINKLYNAIAMRDY